MLATLDVTADELQMSDTVPFKGSRHCDIRYKKHLHLP